MFGDSELKLKTLVLREEIPKLYPLCGSQTFSQQNHVPLYENRRRPTVCRAQGHPGTQGQRDLSLRAH